MRQECSCSTEQTGERLARLSVLYETGYKSTMGKGQMRPFEETRVSLFEKNRNTMTE